MKTKHFLLIAIILIFGLGIQLYITNGEKNEADTTLIAVETALIREKTESEKTKNFYINAYKTSETKVLSGKFSNKDLGEYLKYFQIMITAKERNRIAKELLSNFFPKK